MKLCFRRQGFFTTEGTEDTEFRLQKNSWSPRHSCSGRAGPSGLYEADGDPLVALGVAAGTPPRQPPGRRRYEEAERVPW